MEAFIYADAAVGPSNPGPAGAGYVIVYPDEGSWTAVAGCVPLTERTHNAAEYEAVILALTIRGAGAERSQVYREHLFEERRSLSAQPYAYPAPGEAARSPMR